MMRLLTLWILFFILLFIIRILFLLFFLHELLHKLACCFVLLRLIHLFHLHICILFEDPQLLLSLLQLPL